MKGTLKIILRCGIHRQHVLEKRIGYHITKDARQTRLTSKRESLACCMLCKKRGVQKKKGVFVYLGGNDSFPMAQNDEKKIKVSYNTRRNGVFH